MLAFALPVLNDESSLMNTVINLNKKYSTIVEESEEVSRNINWKLNKFEWDNLFNYGEANVLDFQKLNGIVGIFGKTNSTSPVST